MKPPPSGVLSISADSTLDGLLPRLHSAPLLLGLPVCCCCYEHLCVVSSRRRLLTCRQGGSLLRSSPLALCVPVVVGRVTHRYELSGDSCYPISLIMAGLSNSHDHIIVGYCLRAPSWSEHTPITHCVIFHWKHSLRHGHQGILWAVIVHTNASGLLFVSLLQCIDIHYVIPGCIYSVSIDIFCLKNVGKQWKKSQYS